MKKTLAILLSLALVICMIPATAFAATPLNGATVTLSQDSFVYDGTNKAPTVTSVKTSEGADVAKGGYDASYPTSAVDVGEYTVTVTGKSTGDEGYSGSATKNYTITELDLSNATIIENATNPITSQNPNSDNIVVKYNGQTINSDLYTVVPSTLSNGMIRVTVTAKTVSAGEKQNLKAGSWRTADFYVKTNLNEKDSNYNDIYTIKEIPTQVYSGSEKTPAVTILKNGTAMNMTLGTDYKVTYSNNIRGGQNGTVRVEGLGNYTGTLETSFYIDQRSISSSGIVATVNTTAVGNQPVVVVKDGNAVLTSDDYYCSTVDTSKAGTAKVLIYGTGNYKESTSATFAVVDKSIENVVVNTINPSYTAATLHANLTVTGSDKQTLTKNTDYKVSYEYTDPITGKTTTTDSPKDTGSYKIIVTGIGKYGGTIESYFRIEPISLDWVTVSLNSSTILYNGVYVPKVTVKHYNGNIIPEKDYTVTYLNIGNSYSYAKPTAVVTATRRGNLSATGKESEKRIEFSLASRNLSNCTVTFTDSRSSKNYDGNASFKPPVTVKDYSINKTLTENLDYKITYKDAAGKVVYALKDAGTYSVIVEGINAYTGTKTLTFTINGTDISGYTVTLKESSVNATGYAQTPVILSVKKGVYSSLTSNDYTVTYQDATGKTVTSMSAPGTYKVVVTGKNGYSGSTYATFRIVGLPQTVTVNQDSYKVYTTSDSFKITAKATGDGTGFTYTSSNPAVASVSAAGYVTIHKVGRAVITVTTTGNKKYEPTSKDVTVKVYPSKAKISQKPSTDGKKGQMKVRWGYQDGVTKYQIRYSRDKNFKSGSYLTKTVKAHGKSYTTQSTTISNLKSGYTYYFKVRAVYTDPYTGDTYYGSWSPWRSAKTK